MPAVFPAKNKSWQLIYYPVGSAKAGLLAMKNVFTTPAQSPYTVVSSCDSTTVSATDLWTSTGALIRNASSSGARSWIVLRSPTGVQLLIDYYSNQDIDCRMYLSPSGGFTGGTTTASPTASDQIPDATTALVQTVCNAVTRIYGMHSTDGRFTHIVNHSSTFSAIGGAMFIGEPLSPPAGWSTPFLLHRWAVASGVTEDNYRLLGLSGAQPGIIVPKAGGFATARGVILGGIPTATDDSLTGSLTLTLTAINEISNQYQPLAIGVFCNDDGLYDFLGEIPDYYACPGGAQGDFAPGDGSKAWMRSGNSLRPWDGVSAVLF